MKYTIVNYDSYWSEKEYYKLYYLFSKKKRESFEIRIQKSMCLNVIEKKDVWKEFFIEFFVLFFFIFGECVF